MSWRVYQVTPFLSKFVSSLLFPHLTLSLQRTTEWCLYLVLCAVFSSGCIFTANCHRTLLRILCCIVFVLQCTSINDWGEEERKSGSWTVLSWTVPLRLTPVLRSVTPALSWHLSSKVMVHAHLDLTPVLHGTHKSWPDTSPSWYMHTLTWHLSSMVHAHLDLTTVLHGTRTPWPDTCPWYTHTLIWHLSLMLHAHLDLTPVLHGTRTPWPDTNPLWYTHTLTWHQSSTVQHLARPMTPRWHQSSMSELPRPDTSHLRYNSYLDLTPVIHVRAPSTWHQSSTVQLLPSSDTSHPRHIYLDFTPVLYGTTPISIWKIQSTAEEHVLWPDTSPPQRNTHVGLTPILRAKSPTIIWHRSSEVHWTITWHLSFTVGHLPWPDTSSLQNMPTLTWH